MRLRRLLFQFVLILSATILLFSQDRRPLIFEFGGAVGVPVNSALGTQFISPGQTANQNLDRPKILAGPVIDAVLYNRALIEFGAFYRPAKFEIDFVTAGSCIDPLCTRRNPGTATVISGQGQLWEFPLSANYYIGERHIHPYFGGGILLSQDLSGTRDGKSTDLTTGASTMLSGPIGQFRPIWPSFIADAGLELTRSRFRLRPELRYTRHRADHDPFAFGVVLHPDQIDLLLSVSFRKQ